MAIPRFTPPHPPPPPQHNKTGFDMGHPSYRVEEWVNAYDAAHPERPLVDIGCGLGTNALHAVAQGARVVAVDMTQAHLDEIEAKAGRAVMASGQLQTRFGKLPDDVPVKDGEAAAVLCAQVLHFLGPDAVEKSFAQFHRCLAPGGKLVVLACAHYIIMNHVDPARMAAIDAGMAADPEGAHGWHAPGEATLHKALATFEERVPAALRQATPDASRGFLTFSTPQLAACARRAGFAVLECEYADGRLSNYPDFLSAEDPALRGREQVVLVAQKPLAAAGVTD